MIRVTQHLKIGGGYGEGRGVMAAGAYAGLALNCGLLKLFGQSAFHCFVFVDIRECGFVVVTTYAGLVLSNVRRDKHVRIFQTCALVDMAGSAIQVWRPFGQDNLKEGR
jgi:hypothetical protein